MFFSYPYMSIVHILMTLCLHHHKCHQDFDKLWIFHGLLLHMKQNRGRSQTSRPTDHQQQLEIKHYNRCFYSFQICNTTRYLYDQQYNQFFLSKKVRFGSSYSNIKAEIVTTTTVVLWGIATGFCGVRLGSSSD